MSGYRRHISTATADYKKYLQDKREGRIKDILTGWEKVNQTFGGLEIGSVWLFASPSGGGKTAVMTQLEDDIPKKNRDIEVEILTFSMEMHARNIIARKISKATSHPTKYLTQAYGSAPMSESDVEMIDRECDYYKRQNVWYVEAMLTVAQMEREIELHREYCTKKHGEKEFLLFISIDHSVLILEEKGMDERMTLKRLSQMLVRQKKIGNTLFLVLSQTNDELEDEDRLTNVGRQKPKKGDIFGGRALYHAADYVIVGVNPYEWNIETWTREAIPTKGKIFWHILKLRNGQPKTLIMKNELNFSRILDYTEKETK